VLLVPVLPANPLGLGQLIEKRYYAGILGRGTTLLPAKGDKRGNPAEIKREFRFGHQFFTLKKCLITRQSVHK
jgi:hypothetical protein